MGGKQTWANFQVCIGSHSRLTADFSYIYIPESVGHGLGGGHMWRTSVHISFHLFEIYTFRLYALFSFFTVFFYYTSAAAPLQFKKMSGVTGIEKEMQIKLG